MESNDLIVAKCLDSINQFVKDINEIYNDQSLAPNVKHKETMFFICEILRIAIGLADHE